VIDAAEPQRTQSTETRSVSGGFFLVSPDVHNKPVAFTSSELVTLSVGQSTIIQNEIECDGSYPEIGGPGLVLYGVVRYRDAFGKHETWYGYTIHGDPGSHPQLDRLVGFPEYNNNA
jgi:hypothetical protein